MRGAGKSLALLLVLIFLASLVTLQPAVVKAQIQTLIVPDQYPTIQAAIDNASVGDTVYVKSGNYTPAVTDTDPLGDDTIVIDKSISLIGENCQDTIIRTTQAVSWGVGIEVTADNVAISGFTIIGNAKDIALFGSNDVVHNNIINLASSNGIIAVEAISQDTISSNIINSAGQGTSGISGSGTTGIMTWPTSCTTISNNIINGFGMGIQIWSNGDRILNNTLTKNAIGVEAVDNPTLLQFNNIVNCTEYGIYGAAYINATYNWWGTNDTQAIANSITTGNHIESGVTYVPFLTAPNPQAIPDPKASALFPTRIASYNSSSLRAVVSASFIAAVVIVVAALSLLLYRRRRKLQNKKRGPQTIQPLNQEYRPLHSRNPQKPSNLSTSKNRTQAKLNLT